MGGRKGHDGMDAVKINTNNIPNLPTEVLESEYPIRVERYQLVPNTGGAGEFRGGLAARKEFRMLADIDFIAHADRHLFHPGAFSAGVLEQKGCIGEMPKGLMKRCCQARAGRCLSRRAMCCARKLLAAAAMGAQRPSCGPPCDRSCRWKGDGRGSTQELSGRACRCRPCAGEDTVKAGVSGSSEKLSIGIDIGGTFTDVVLMGGRRGVVAKYKVDTTPDALEKCFIHGLERANGGLASHEIARLLHRQRLRPNCVGRKGARTALLVTEGFRDVLEIARQRRPSLYDLLAEKAKPLVPRRLVFEVKERIGADGNVLVPLEEATTRATCRTLSAHRGRNRRRRIVVLVSQSRA